MNKNKVVVISAVAAAIFSSSVMAANVYKDDTTNVDVYGYALGAHKFANHGKKNGVDASELRLGVKGKQQLNETFALTGQYEGQYNIYPQRYVSRQAWGGIDAGKYGAVSVGRQTGAVYDVMGMSDMAPGVLTGYAAENETLTNRSDSIIQYKNTFDNVDVKLQHKLETSGESLEGVKHGTGSAYGTSVVVHDLGVRGSFVGGAYSEQKGKGSSHTTNNIYSVGGGWTDGRVYTAATHTAGKDQKSKHFHDTEVISQYTFDNGLTPSVGYVDTNYHGDNVKSVETGVSYAFNKNVSSYIDAGWDTTGKTNHVFKTGLKYSF